MLVYQLITNDKYELPVYQTDTVKEMAYFLNRSPARILQALSNNWTVDKKKYRIIKIELDDED